MAAFPNLMSPANSMVRQDSMSSPTNYNAYRMPSFNASHPIPMQQVNSAPTMPPASPDEERRLNTYNSAAKQVGQQKTMVQDPAIHARLDSWLQGQATQLGVAHLIAPPAAPGVTPLVQSEIDLNKARAQVATQPAAKATPAEKPMSAADLEKMDSMIRDKNTSPEALAAIRQQIGQTPTTQPAQTPTTQPAAPASPTPMSPADVNRYVRQSTPGPNLAGYNSNVTTDAQGNRTIAATGFNNDSAGPKVMGKPTTPYDIPKPTATPITDAQIAQAHAYRNWHDAPGNENRPYGDYEKFSGGVASTQNAINQAGLEAERRYTTPQQAHDRLMAQGLTGNAYPIPQAQTPPTLAAGTPSMPPVRSVAPPPPPMTGTTSAGAPAPVPAVGTTYPPPTSNVMPLTAPLPPLGPPPVIPAPAMAAQPAVALPTLPARAGGPAPQPVADMGPRAGGPARLHQPQTYKTGDVRLVGGKKYVRQSNGEWHQQ